MDIVTVASVVYRQYALKLDRSSEDSAVVACHEVVTAVLVDNRKKFDEFCSAIFSSPRPKMTLQSIVEGLFEDDTVNWGRMAAVMGLCAVMCEKDGDYLSLAIETTRFMIELPIIARWLSLQRKTTFEKNDTGGLPTWSASRIIGFSLLGVLGGVFIFKLWYES